MSPDHSDQCRPVPGVLQPHRIDSRDEIPGIFEPAPKDRLVQCFIVKDPLTQAYCLFLQLNKQLSTVTNRGKFLMAARPVNSMSYSEFLICGDLEDLTDQSELYYGRLRSNLSRNEFTLWDCREGIRRRSRTSCWPQSGSLSPRSGSVKVADIGYNMTFGKPQKFECTVHTVRYYEAQSDAPKSSSNSERMGIDETATEPSDILTTNYIRSTNILRDVSQSLAKSIAAGAGQMGEADVTIDKFLQSVAEPWSSDSLLKSSRVSSESSLKSVSSGSSHSLSIKSDTSPRSSLRKTLSRKKTDEAKVGDGVVDVPLLLRTRLYTWDKTCKRYYTDFNRGDIPGSAKNFQLVAANHGQRENDKILLQFGQAAGQEIFFMDYRYPLTAFEAFGICLTRLS